MIRGYPDLPSLYPGQRLVLHVSTDSPRFRVEFYQQGETLTRMDTLGGVLDGYAVPDGPPDLDWGWPSYPFDIPADWRSGAYIAMLIEIAEDGRETLPDVATSFGTDAKALFILRHRGATAPGTMLYKVSWATFVAYNATGYGSLYSEAMWSGQDREPGFKVTWRRPGCGTGGIVMAADPVDFYDTSSRRQTFEHWDAPFISWLERNGYAPHYCTDWDLQFDPAVLDDYSLLLSVGHDEYWSPEMRRAIERHIKRGRNVAFFSGNICGYRIHFTDENTAFTCAKAPPSAQSPERWVRDSWFEFEPENKVTGVAIKLAGGWWDGKRETLGYTVQHSQHWVFQGTELADGDVFGADEAFPLIGYEADGAAYTWRNGRAVVTGEFGTPQDFAILGFATLGDGWVASMNGAAATMGIYSSTRGGIVFQGATTDWPILVPRNGHVAAITRNVLDRLRLPSCRVIGPLPARGGRMLAAVNDQIRFHVDCGPLGPVDELTFDWRVAGAVRFTAQGPVLEATMPATPDLVTSSVTVRRFGEPIAFGSRTLVLLSAKEAAEVDLLIGIRELAFPEDPNNSLAAPTKDPLHFAPMLFSDRISWIEERARRILRSAERLTELRRRTEAKPPESKPIRPRDIDGERPIGS
jgi:hypothetical protein